MRPAERLIGSIQLAYLKRVATAWKGREPELLVEIVRGLDEASFAFMVAPNRTELIRGDTARRMMISGGASALRAVLEIPMRGLDAMAPLPTSPELARLADWHLVECGRLAVVKRIAALERYGLADASFPADGHLVLEVAADHEDASERRASAWLGNSMRQGLSDAEARLIARKGEIASRIDRLARVQNGCLRCDHDEGLVSYHHEYAALLNAGNPDADALPPDAVLGGRSFAEWNEASITAFGRVLHRVALATRMKGTGRASDLRSLLTGLVSKRVVIDSWRRSGTTGHDAESLVAALSLDASTAAAFERDHDLPLPYYIDLSPDRVLTPVFGGLLNASAGLTSFLRRRFRSDWDRAVNGRERAFRTDLRGLFPSPRYAIPERNFDLRRSDGSSLTDIDAVLIDNLTGRLGLIQLKWADIHGHSLAERNSKRLNLLKANEWVEKVADRVQGRSSSEVAGELGVTASSAAPPVIVVLARHATRFGGEHGFDPRACWVSWPRLVQAHRQDPEGDILDRLARSSLESAQPRREPVVAIHQLPGLTVEVRSW